MSTSTAPHDETDPKSRPLNPLVNPLLTDLYAITMAYAHWRNGRHRETATYELFFRRNPFGGEYTVFAGLEECIPCGIGTSMVLALVLASALVLALALVLGFGIGIGTSIGIGVGC